MLEGYMNATGEIQETLTNDMVFHKIMSASKTALIGLCCSLKGIAPEDVKDAIITNPIDYGKVTDKQIILDVRIELNNSEIINIEVMTYYPANWRNRSIYYLCRCFDNIENGEDYNAIKPVTQIGIMSAIPEEESTHEFYAHYLLKNVVTGEPYTTNLCLNVLDLRHIDKATDEDRKHKVDYWARLFLARTWEEFRAAAAEDPAFREVGKLMYNINADEMERNLCEAHRKYVLEWNTQYSSGKKAGVEETESYYKPIIEEKDKQLAEQESQLAEQDKQLAERDKQLAEQDKQLTDMSERIARLEAALAAK